MKIEWKPDMLTLPYAGILRDEKPYLVWFEIGSRSAEDSALHVEFELPELRRRRRKAAA